MVMPLYLILSLHYTMSMSVKREREGAKAQLSKNVEVLKSLEQKYAKLKQDESSIKQEG